MAINLEEHKIFIKDLNMEVVPFSIAVQAMQELESSLEAFYNKAPEINSHMEDLKEAFKEINKAISELKVSNDDLDVDLDDKN